MDIPRVFRMINMDFMSRQIRKLRLRGLRVNRRPVSLPFLGFGPAKLKKYKYEKWGKTIVYSNG